MPAFIETQFPIARLSAESYKERKANNGQTLTRLGKWWGRKPLILVRASILGMLMPASSDAKKDREIFLKILTMDDEGTWDRSKGEIESRTEFDAMPYAARISRAHHCERPENVEGPTESAWAEINAHLGTTATSLTELVEQLGQRTFGHTPRVGDSFLRRRFHSLRGGTHRLRGLWLRPQSRGRAADLGQPESARWRQGRAGRGDARAGRGALPLRIDRSPNGALNTTNRANAPTPTFTAWRSSPKAATTSFRWPRVG
jgi:adenine-specific DNA methylase